VKRVLQGAIVGVVLGVAGTAGAYRTAGDLPEYAGTERVRWRSNVVRYQLQSDVPANLTPEDVLTALETAFGAWSAPECSQFEAVSDGANAVHAAPGDGLNTIEFVSSGWASRGYDPTAGGVTDTQYAQVGDGPGEIVEADIYINADGVNLTLGASDGGNAGNLPAVLRHEAGHFVGLLHPCEIGGAGGAPDCAADPSFKSTIMYPTYQAARIRRRSWSCLRTTSMGHASCTGPMPSSDVRPMALAVKRPVPPHRRTKFAPRTASAPATSVARVTVAPK
jgi:hypothetical protein